MLRACDVPHQLGLGFRRTVRAVVNPESCRNRLIVKNQGRHPPCVIAEALVRNCLPDLLNAVRTLRASGVRIRDIKPDILAPLLPSKEMETLERLCVRFQDELPSRYGLM